MERGRGDHVAWIKGLAVAGQNDLHEGLIILGICMARSAGHLCNHQYTVPDGVANHFAMPLLHFFSQL